ncbi:hypothetical protein BH24CHL4_BH24CHL4_22670 [soil metagenome]
MASPRIGRRVLFAGLFIGTLLFSLSQPAAARQDGPDDGPVVKLELILDSSGSMSEEIEPGVARIEAAKQVLNAVIDALPQAEDVNVGLRVYGHEGSNTEAGRAESCRSTELKTPILGVDEEALRAEIDAYQPAGWTPIALSMTSAENDFEVAAEGVENHVVLLTDGLETCGGDPCAASRQLKNGPNAITTHVIGFALAAGEQESLQCVVEASGGLLQGAATTAELRDALFLVLEELDVIKTTGFIEIEEFGGEYPQATATRKDDQTEPGEETADTEPEETTFSFTTTNWVEVPAGQYSITWTNPSGSQTAVSVSVVAGETAFIRGSMLRLPYGDGALYELSALDGTVIWSDSVDFGEAVWLLPGTYRLEVDSPAATTMILSMVVQTLPGVVTEVTTRTEP